MTKAIVVSLFCVSLLSAYWSETDSAPMRDGTLLVTDVHYPFPGISPWPTIVIRTPYDRTQTTEMLVLICDVQRYALVVQSVRGMQGSQGNPSFFLTDGWGTLQDGYDCIEWVHNQWFCDGTIGMWGGSAYGITQYLAAGSLPPHLLCCQPLIATPRLYQDAAFQGGEFRKNLVENWLAYLGTPWLADTPAAHPDYDSSYWGTTDLSRRYDLVHLPFYHMAGWYDLFLDGGLDAFTNLQARNHNQKLLIGPWAHGDLWGVVQQGDLTYPANAGRDNTFFADELIAWNDYWLFGRSNGIMDLPRVVFYLMGDCDTPDTTLWNHWVQTDTWPLPDVSYVPYYLRDGHLLDPSAPGPAEKPDTARYDPLNPCPTIGGREYLGLPDGYGPKDQRPVEARPDVLCYETGVLESPVTVVGKVKVRLFGSSDRLDTDWMVRICDVYPDGRSILVTDGALMARHRRGLDREDLLVPGVPDTFDIDLWSTALVFNVGHRIRISVSSSNYPRFERNPNTGGPFRRNDTLGALVATNVVYHDQALPSALLLPIWPEGPTAIKERRPENAAHSTFYLPHLTVASPTRSPQFILQMPQPGRVLLSIQDVTGRKVERLADGVVAAGVARYAPSRTLPPGVYYVRMEAVNRRETRKLVVIP